MKNKTLGVLTPLCLCLFAANAWADLEPFSFGASETLQHQSNFNHSSGTETTGTPPVAGAPIVADWISTTELNAALNQALGRDKLVASAAVDFTRYKHSHQLNATGYSGAAEFDWNTIGDLSGALGADSRRRQFIYGDTADLNTTNGSQVDLNARNLQTDNHAFARIALGGESRWTIFGGADANQRTFSSPAFDNQEERQWSSNVGTRYSTSPDLSFGVTASYVRGDYPHPGAGLPQSDFNSKSVDATTKWQASGNSALDASVGVTSEDNDALGGTRRFVNGSLNWTWTPPSHFTVNVGLKRSSDADTSSTGATTGIVNASNLNGTSINNVGHLEVTYALTAKTSLDASADYTQRKYGDLQTLDGIVFGSTRTSRFYLTAHFLPTRTTDVSCGGGRETRHADATLKNLAEPYSDNYVQCAASIRFD